MITISTDAGTFTITNTKLYVLVVTLSIQDNTKLLHQLQSSFKRTINLNKYQSMVAIERKKQYLDYLSDQSFQGVNRRFVLSFENNAIGTRYSIYFLPTVQMKDYNVMIDGQNIFDQPARNDPRTYDNTRKITTGQGTITQLVVS